MLYILDVKWGWFYLGFVYIMYMLEKFECGVLIWKYIICDLRFCVIDMGRGCCFMMVFLGIELR